MADIIHKPTKSEFKRMAAQLGYGAGGALQGLQVQLRGY